MRHDWLIPDWPAPAGVRAVCTTRSGGVSVGPYESLNLGDHVGDAPTAVQANRRLLEHAVGVRPVFLQQIHGWQMATLDVQTPDGTPADGCMSSSAGVACTIMVADCLPVLLTNRRGSAVAAAHAGWRGLAGQGGRGVLESVLASFMALSNMQYGFTATGVIAWLGPCIGPEQFEVGPEVKAAFEASDPQAGGLFKPHGDGKWLADLPGLARRRLQAMGVTSIHGNDGSVPWCTVSNPSRFFSHRRDTSALGASGRFAACVWLA
ncbi:MAG: peptidoglycan editing factor PgeF [Rhodoferax sp.]